MRHKTPHHPATRKEDAVHSQSSIRLAPEYAARGEYTGEV